MTIDAFSDLLREYAASGLTIKEAAANIGYSYEAVYKCARTNGIKFRHGRTIPKTAREQDCRTLAMKAAYESGKTLHEIGQEHGVTRERVRQLLTETFGITAKDGGGRVRSERTRAKVFAEREAQALRKWGCTFAQYRLLRIISRKLVANGAGDCTTPLGAFRQQKANAKQRGIGWELSLWQWWTIWQKSGKWDRRGRHLGSAAFVMCRKGDVGPYSVENVHIAPSFANVSEANRKAELPIGVHRVKSGKFKAIRIMGGKTLHLGLFDTPEEAGLAYLQSLSLQEAA
jgi:hypothetical protein